MQASICDTLHIAQHRGLWPTWPMSSLDFCLGGPWLDWLPSSLSSCLGGDPTWAHGSLTSCWGGRASGKAPELSQVHDSWMKHALCSLQCHSLVKSQRKSLFKGWLSEVSLVLVVMLTGLGFVAEAAVTSPPS